MERLLDRYPAELEFRRRMLGEENPEEFDDVNGIVLGYEKNCQLGRSRRGRCRCVGRVPIVGTLQTLARTGNRCPIIIKPVFAVFRGEIHLQPCKCAPAEAGFRD